MCVEVRLSVLLQGVWVDAVNPPTGDGDSGQRWQVGAGPGADFSWLGLGDFGPFASLELAALATQVEVHSFGTEHSVLPRWQYSAALGFRWRPR